MSLQSTVSSLSIRTMHDSIPSDLAGGGMCQAVRDPECSKVQKHAVWPTIVCV